MSIKQKIFKKLDESGYITDTDVAKIYGGEPNWSTTEEYKRQWKKLQSDRAFFFDKEITHAHKGNRVCLVDTPDGSWICGREYFDEIVKDMEVDNSRPDLRMQMYKKLST